MSRVCAECSAVLTLRTSRFYNGQDLCRNCLKVIEEGAQAPSILTAAASGLTLHGSQGKTLTVTVDMIRIEKQSFVSGKREKSIPIRNVTSVEVKKPGGFVGFIQFSIAGGKARDSSYTFSGGALDAVKDENSVVFKGQDKYEIALRIKDYVESYESNQRKEARSTVGEVVSVADEIRKLKALLDEDLITAEEFDQQKMRLLGK